MLNGNEQALTANRQRTGNPIIDPAGRWVDCQSFPALPQTRRRDAFRINLDGSEPRSLREGFASLGETATGGHRVLAGPDWTIHVWDRDTKTTYPLALPEKSDEHSNIQSGSSSPDGKSLALISQVGSDRQIFVIPFIPGRTIPRSDWTEITKPENRSDAPVWSPGGRLLYYTSRKNDETRIMAVPMEKGKPAGEHFMTFRLHEPARKLVPATSFPTAFSVAANWLVFSVSQSKSEIRLQK